MLCPVCSSPNTQVKDSRETDEGKVIRRRRECAKCKGKFTTFERVQIRELYVVKRSGIKKKFDREKIATSIKTAVRKRSITEEKIHEIIDNIVAEVSSSGKKEIYSRIIGEKIMRALAEIDEVAYIRFASVYKDFTSAKDFARFIQILGK